jgi:hypothetical protein
VVDAEDHDFALGLVDSIRDTVGAPPCCVDTGEVPAQLLADAMGFLDLGSGEELDASRGYALG